ncbi:TetR/AcrR family transcriptional regulator [Streptomyces sp. NPDC018031]|uniref:TetR/AcrR family transcriptional regulator n=1 Tax=Streptomyces sp. NPDC018031 TaxID=3365033 RepID=UPI0037AD8325
MARNSASRATRMPPTDRRSQILAAARRVLEVRAIDDISVEAVAGEAGVSPGLLFHYFGSQRKFRHAVLEAAAEELLAHVRPDPALSPAEQLRAGAGTFVEYVARYPTIYQAVTRLNRGADVRSLHSSSRATLGDWITGAVSGVGVRITPAMSLAITGWLAYMEEVVLAWLDEPTLTRPELIDLCERSFYQLARAALDDDEQWEQVVRRIHRRPGEAEPPPSAG